MKLIPYILTLLLLVSPITVFAHPGNTASDGCHYCRTRCDYWGVPWNERHCHGGGTIEAPPREEVKQQIIPTKIPPTVTPTRIPTPTKTPTKAPTATLTPTLTNTPTPTNTPVPTNTTAPTFEPTKTPEVLGETVNTTTQTSSSGNPLGGLAIFAWIVYGVFKFVKKIRKNKENN